MKGKSVLITGASLGIGRETALAFAREGAKVGLTYLEHRKEAEEAGRKCRELGAADVLVTRLDVTDDGSIQEAVEKAAERFGGLDVLVNNAGVIAWKPLEEQSMEEIGLQARVNLEGLVKMTRAAYPHVREAVVNVSSGAGKTGYATLTTYCATKFGVRGFTQALAKEAPFKVYSVNPGSTMTRMTNFRGTPPEKVAEVILKAAKGVYGVESGGDVDVWEHV